MSSDDDISSNQESFDDSSVPAESYEDEDGLDSQEMEESSESEPIMKKKGAKKGGKEKNAQVPKKLCEISRASTLTCPCSF